MRGPWRTPQEHNAAFWRGRLYMADEKRLTKDEVREAVLGRVGARLSVKTMARDIGCSEEMVAVALEEIEEEGRPQ